MDTETEEDNDPISLEEWLQVVEEDNDLKLTESIQGINPITRTKILIKEKGLAIWRHTEKDYDVEFHFEKGKVCADGYDDCLINKMKQLAERLNAKVSGIDE
jgi:hypothetical protein